jgi:thymidylate synthase (FAD)
MDGHAQLEIRTYANVIFKPIVPIAFEAFRDYRLDAMQLSGPEVRYILSMMNGSAGDLHYGSELSDRERVELKARLARLGLQQPAPDRATDETVKRVAA